MPEEEEHRTRHMDYTAEDPHHFDHWKNSDEPNEPMVRIVEFVGRFGNEPEPTD